MRITKKSVFVLTIALLASLALNVFLGGMLAGRYYLGPPSWAAKDTHLRAHLTGPDRAALRRIMAKNAPEIRALKAELDIARKAVRNATQGGDEDTLDTALQAEQAVKTALLRHIRDTRATAMDSLSPQGRATLAAMGMAARHHLFGDTPPPVFVPDIAGPDEPDFDFWWMED